MNVKWIALVVAAVGTVITTVGPDLVMAYPKTATIIATLTTIVGLFTPTTVKPVEKKEEFK